MRRCFHVVPRGLPVAVGSAIDARRGCASVDPTRITRDIVWGLWNEGNLYSLSAPELAAFLRQEGHEPPATGSRSALVHAVGDLLAKTHAATAGLTNPAVAEDSVDSAAREMAAEVPAGMLGSVEEYASGAMDLMDEADVYGDWGTSASGDTERRSLDYMATSGGRRIGATALTGGLAPRAFQLLHVGASSSVGLAKLTTRNLPGCSGLRDAYTAVALDVEEANRQAFRRSFKWALRGLWNSSLDGEINIGAGKALYRRAVAKHNRSVLPHWTCQDHLYRSHPYAWFAVAAESNVGVMEQLAADLGMTPEGDGAETSFKASIRRSRDIIDMDLNAHLQPTAANRPWDRILMTHYLRDAMPDIRLLVRARQLMDSRVADAYQMSPILRAAGDSVQSVLPADLGEVQYVCQRRIRRWSVPLDGSGVKLSLVETQRLPLITTQQGDEGGVRLEYELISTLPQKVERVDADQLADQLWGFAARFATALEEGMLELQGFTMPSSAAFDDYER